MPITRDPNYSPEGAALLAAFNGCADGHDTLTVLDATVNFLVAALLVEAKSAALSRSDALARAGEIGCSLPELVAFQMDRTPHPTDMKVGQN